MKPKRLHNTPLIKLKRKFAEKWAKENGYIYKIRDMKKLTQIDINNLYKKGKIFFEPRYQKLFLEKYAI